MTITASRLRELFDAARALPPEQRAAFVSQACGDDQELRRELDALFAAETAHENATPGIVAMPPPDEPAWLGRRVGNYRILRELGSGGMGSVYLADRADREYESRVAIKLIRGFPSADALERLRHERQVLAGLIHPNIARLLDGGTTAEGQPFLVIEYVEGLPLGDWAQQREPALRERLRVLLELCRAVHHAHQNLIVHRDLKPGNVIVRADGSPVLLDFGIAKLTSPDVGGERLTELRAFTLDYASPEQIQGGAVTTASDIYALGLILYELLCGKRYQGSARSESWRLARPSRIARGADRAFLRSAAAQVHGDLEHIVRRALADEPQRRYASAAALAHDIENYFAGRPVEAGPDRLGYRLRTFVRRHRAGVAATALAFVIVLGAALWLGVERNRAVRAERRALTEAQTANQVTEFLLHLFEAADPKNARGKELSARELLDGGREMLGTSLGDQPLVRARLLSALGQIYVSIGQPKRSVEVLDEAVTLLRKPGADPLRLAFALNELCRARDGTSEFDAALAACREALQIRERLLQPGDADIGHTLMALGVVEQELNHSQAAGEDFHRALGIFDAAGPQHADDVASAHHNLGFLAQHLEDYATARREYQIALDGKRALHGDMHPSNLISLEGLANVEGALGDFTAERRDLEQALKLREQVHGHDSSWVGRSENDLAGALQDLGDYVGAEAHYRVALEIHAKVSGPDSWDTATSTNNLGTLLEDRGEFAAAVPLYRRSLEIRRTKFKPPHMSLARAENNLARCLLELGDLAAAKPLLDSSRETRVALAPTSSERLESDLLAAEWTLASGDWNGAKTALGLLVVPEGRGNYRRRARWYALAARIAAAGNDWAQARAQQQRSIDALREAAPADHPLVAQAQLRLAEYAHATHDDAAARTALDAAAPVLARALPASAPDLVAAKKLGVALATGEQKKS